MIHGILFSVLAVAFLIMGLLYYIDYTCLISSKNKKRIIPGQEANAYKRAQKNYFIFGIITACMAFVLFLNIKEQVVYLVGFLVCICFAVPAYKEEKEYYL